MGPCDFYLLSLFCFISQSYANPYGYYYPSYSRSRRDPAAPEWQQINQLQNYGNAYGYPQQYQQYNQQLMQPSGSEYQNNYRDAVVPPLVPLSGSGKTTDSELYSQQQAGYTGGAGNEAQGGLYHMFGRNADAQNQAIQQPLPANGYGVDMQQPTRLDDYKPSMDFSQMSNVQQPNTAYGDNMQHQANAHTGGQTGQGSPYAMEGDSNGLGMVGGGGDVPNKCFGVTCDSLTNCVNVSVNETDCCPKCVQYGCECEGYQYFDCVNNGFSDGMVPEGEVYYVDQHSTQCFCPMGGGSITCRYQDPNGNNECPQLPPNCLKTYQPFRDACEECIQEGCVDDDGTKYEYGDSFDKSPCEMCYCPPTGGGKLVCGKYPSCDENSGPSLQNAQQKQQSQENDVQGFQASIRTVDAMGKVDGYGNVYPQYGEGFGNGYNGYPDYGAYLRQQQAVPPAEGSDGSDGKDTVVPDLTSAEGNSPSANNQQGDYGTGYNMFQNPYNGYENTGGYFNPQNPYPAYGYNAEGYGYGQGYNNPYAPVDANTKSEDEMGAKEDDESPKSVEGEESVVQQDSSIDGASDETASNSKLDTYQQLYPYFQQQQQGSYGGYPNGYSGNSYGYPAAYPQHINSDNGNAGAEGNTQNYLGNSLYAQQGQQTELNSNQAKSAESKMTDPTSSANRVNPSNAPPTNQKSNLYPYDPYAAYNAQSGTNLGNLNPQQAYDAVVPNSKQTKDDVGSPKVSEGDNKGDLESQANSISNPYLDPNYNPSLSGYGQAGQFQAQNVYPYNFAGYYPEAAGSATGGKDNQVTGQKKVKNPEDNDGTKNVDAGGNELPNVMNPYAGYHQQLQGYYPYGNPYYNQYNTLYGGYNMQQGDLYAQSQLTSSQGKTEDNKDPLIPRPSKDTVVPGLVGVDGNQDRASIDERSSLQPKPTESGVKKVLLEQTQPVAKNQKSRRIKEPRVVNVKQANVGTTTTMTTTPAATTTPPPQQRKKIVQPSLAQVSYDNVLTQCCNQGRSWASSHETCIGIDTGSQTYNQICKVVQEKCCLEEQGHKFCSKGKNTARSMAACDQPAGDTCGATQFKTCCDCCALGLKANGLQFDCDVKIFGEPCNSAYRDCCLRGHIPDHGSIDSSSSSGSQKETSRSSTPFAPEPLGPHCATDSACEQRCTDTTQGMVCSCRRGYRLAEDKRSCADVNECVLGTHNCHEGQFCINKIGSFDCRRRLSCGTGYTLTDDNECEDINECELGLHNCGHNMECENARGSFRCKAKLCDDGFFTDATGNCIDVDECSSGDYTCPELSECWNTNGGYNCVCRAGYEMNRENTVCSDINECLNNPCAGKAKCKNTIGSYTCIEPPKLRCSAGYKPNPSGTACVDIDECLDGSHTCSAGSTCINDRGGFRCQDPLVCDPGLRPSADQRLCIDVDECQDPRKNFCSPGGSCVNTHGSFSCSCRQGYKNTTNEDGYPTCTDIDECATAAGESCAYGCRNTPGNFECYCPAGYSVKDFGHTCEDIDECSQPNTCSSAETCFNTKGSFKCVNITCPPEYTRNRNKCQRKSCRSSKNRLACFRLPKQITHNNISLKSNASVDTPIFRMTFKRIYSSDKHEFSITKGNTDNSFKLVTTIRGRSPSGVVYTNKRLIGPKEYFVEMTLRLYRRRRWGKFISHLYVFVGEYDF